MAESDAALVRLIEVARESRTLEYKGTRGREAFSGTSDAAREKITRSVIAMANIGGGDIVIGMDQAPDSKDRWLRNGVPPAIDQGFRQDDVQRYVNQRAAPYVRLALHHIRHLRRRFVVIRVEGFDESPVVCTKGTGRDLRAERCIRAPLN